MNIASISTGLANVEMSGKIGTAVLSNSLDMMETLGDGLVDMLQTSAMERSVNPAVGGNVDVRI